MTMISSSIDVTGCCCSHDLLLLPPSTARGHLHALLGMPIPLRAGTGLRPRLVNNPALFLPGRGALGERGAALK